MSNYTVARLNSMADIRSLFPDGKADQLNWLLCSTSGVHGTYASLDSAAAKWQDATADPTYLAREGPITVTVLVIKPRLCTLGYGEIEVTPEDIAFLRGIVQSSLQEIVDSQYGNLLEAPPDA